MITISEITDKKTWEIFLLSLPDKKAFPFFQTWNWGEVQKNLGHKIWRYGMYEGKVLVGICLIVDIKAKRGHYLHLRHGPVIPKFEKYFPHFLNFVKELAIKEKVSFLRISPLLFKSMENTQFIKSLGFRFAPIHNMDAEICSMLDITKPEEVILANMRKSHRYLIKKAPTYNLEIIKSQKGKDIEKFLEFYKDFSNKKGFVAHNGLVEEFNIFGKDNQALLFLAKYEGKEISGMLIDFIGPVAIYHHAASDNEYRNIPANYLLLWEAIKEAKKRGAVYFNLFGIAPFNKPNHPWQGFTLFKTGFGGETVEFVHAMDLPLSSSYWKTFLIDFVTKKRKGY